mgnify:FL=1|tara:strand:- start:370 stop:507 length:138 start_codon:yes stop_codon:yes gene_type:complete
MASFNTKNTLAVNKAAEAIMIFFDIISKFKIVSTIIVLIFTIVAQ